MRRLVSFVLSNFLQNIFHFRCGKAAQCLRAEVARLEHVQEKRICRCLVRRFENRDDIVLSLRPDNLFQVTTNFRCSFFEGFRPLDRILDVAKPLLSEVEQVDIPSLAEPVSFRLRSDCRPSYIALTMHPSRQIMTSDHWTARRAYSGGSFSAPSPPRYARASPATRQCALSRRRCRRSVPPSRFLGRAFLAQGR